MLQVKASETNIYIDTCALYKQCCIIKASFCHTKCAAWDATNAGLCMQLRTYLTKSAHAHESQIARDILRTIPSILGKSNLPSANKPRRILLTCGPDE
jgi:hypothetical protein